MNNQIIHKIFTGLICAIVFSVIYKGCKTKAEAMPPATLIEKAQPELSLKLEKAYEEIVRLRSIVDSMETVGTDADWYVIKYADLAMAEMERTGVPASITLAQGMLESSCGNSKLATRINNHFGIKCFSKKCTQGHCSNFDDDTHKDFFRTFGSPEESYIAHSNFLQAHRYKSRTKNLSRKDYKSWSQALKDGGYATDPTYAKKLIRVIEKYKLQQFDR